MIITEKNCFVGFCFGQNNWSFWRIFFLSLAKAILIQIRISMKSGIRIRFKTFWIRHTAVGRHMQEHKRKMHAHICWDFDLKLGSSYWNIKISNFYRKVIAQNVFHLHSQIQATPANKLPLPYNYFIRYEVGYFCKNATDWRWNEKQIISICRKFGIIKITLFQNIKYLALLNQSPARAKTDW